MEQAKYCQFITLLSWRWMEVLKGIGRQYKNSKSGVVFMPKHS